MIINICLGAVAVGVILLCATLRVIHNSKKVCPQCGKRVKKKYAMAFIENYGWQLFGRVAKWFITTTCGCGKEVDSDTKFFSYFKLLWRVFQFWRVIPSECNGFYPEIHRAKPNRRFEEAAKLISQHAVKPPPSGHYRVLACTSLRPGAR